MIAGCSTKACEAGNITAAGPREERGMELQKKHGIRATQTTPPPSMKPMCGALRQAPETDEVMKGLKGLRSDAMVLSIIAGANIKKISTGLKHKAVVRSMPNTPGQIGEGITVWTASKSYR